MQNSSLALGGREDTLMSVKQKFVQPVIDMQDDLPKCLKELYPVACVKSSNDAFVIALHAFMLEVGFIPKDVPENEIGKSLPKNWCDGNIYRIAYYHPTCPELRCLVTCVPLNQILSVFGTVDDVGAFQEVNLCLQVSAYVNCTTGYTDPSKVFSNMRELSQNFKDNFAYPLLAKLQDALGFGPTFGLSIIMDDIKMQILSSLPVESLVAMECVNTEFNELCKMPSLWKNLYIKDFSNDHPILEVKPWKEMYKERYLSRRQKNILPSTFFPACIIHDPLFRPWHRFPDNGPVFHEEVLGAFPQLQRRIRANDIIQNRPVHGNLSLNYSGMSDFFFFS